MTRILPIKLDSLIAGMIALEVVCGQCPGVEPLISGEALAGALAALTDIGAVVHAMAPDTSLKVTIDEAAA